MPTTTSSTARPTRAIIGKSGDGVVCTLSDGQHPRVRGRGLLNAPGLLRLEWLAEIAYTHVRG